MRLAWFSPFPPARTGIAGRSAELVAGLRERGYEIDVFVDLRASDAPDGVWSAHDFVWRQARHPHHVVVYQFGNSSHHDYIWPYALRYPGLVVLHDTRLHHARAALLLRERRAADYRAELSWSHPDLNPDLAELAIAGFDSALYYDWPMLRPLVATARVVAVHGAGAAHPIAEAFPGARVRSIRLGEGEPLSLEQRADASRRIRERYGVAAETVLIGAFGGLTQEKRLTQILDALVAIEPYAPSSRLILGGLVAPYFDVTAEIHRRRLQHRVLVTGYLASDADLTDHLAACDISLNLRWPTAGETSGPWLRALALGRPTIVTDLVHHADVPSLDPRTWKGNRVVDPIARPHAASLDPGRNAGVDSASAICVGVDILDEDHSLRLALRRLATDADLRATLGRAAYAWWQREHSVPAMLDDYVRVIAEAASAPAPAVELPSHLRADGSATLRSLGASLGLADALSRDGLLE